MGTGAGSHHNSVKEHYRQPYFDVLDMMINCIKDRFQQKDYQMYVNCEQLLFKAAQRKGFNEEVDLVAQFYGADFNRARLEVHLATVASNFNTLKREGEPSLKDVLGYLQALSKSQRMLMSEVETLAQLLFVMPAH